MYRYETHLHTSPVSRCAKADVRQTLECYRDMNYDGVFITNHFLDGNINIEHDRPYEEKIEFYFSDYEIGLILGKELGIKVFLGVEISYGGTDFLIYGLDKQWFLQHPQIMQMPMRHKLAFFKECGGYVIQAHPFREAAYIDHIRLYPQSVQAVEVMNAGRTDRENKMAELYAQNYGLKEVAGTDNHLGKSQLRFAGIETNTPLNSESDYIHAIEQNQFKIFHTEKTPKS